MFFQHRRLILSGIILAVLLLLAACNSASNGSAQSSPSSTRTPLVVTPKSSQGSPGQGPTIVSTPSPVPNGPAGSQQVVLGDRILIVYSAVKQKSASANSMFINLDLAVHNTSGKTIMNQSTFFQLLGPEGDVYGEQYNRSDNLYGPISAQASSRGNVVFQIPSTAVSKLSLLYRPEVATETVIIPLKIS